MTREEKIGLVNELSEKLKVTPYFYVADTSGFTVAQVNNFRRMCFEKGVDYQIVKNTLVEKALKTLDADHSEMFVALKGTSGIMFASDKGNVPARIIKEYRKKYSTEKPYLKAASVDSAIFIGNDQLATLSDLKSKEELIGDIIGLLQSPAKNVISALQSGGNKLAGILKTLSERES